ncbi:MAG: endonuclease, partial [Syntrophothermus sp.]
TYLEAKMGSNTSNRVVWEPRNSHKGDAARALLYMSVRYDGVSGNWTFNYLNNISLPKFNEGSQDLATLLQWNKMDPPDKWEIDRNNYIQSVQLNRNPFVDHPEWADYINYNDMTLLTPVLAAEPASLPADFKSVSTDSTVTVSWTGSLAGAQAPSGYLILAYSRDNYFIPVDGAVYSDDKVLSDGVARVNITGAGNGTYTFSGLLPATNYYFTIYPYNGSGAQINYKTPGALLRTNVKTTGAAITSLHFETFSGSVFEDAGTYKLNVAIENPSPSAPTTVQVALTSGNSQDLGNFAAQTLTFPAGSTEMQTVTLNLTDNNVIEGSRQAVLSLKNPSGGTYAKVTLPSDFTLTIQDNDGGAQGGLEDFASFPEKGQSYVSGTFAGKDKSVWTYKSCSGNSSVQITAPSPVLQRNSASGMAYIQSGLISGGCGVLSFKYMQAFSYSVNLGVYINDRLITTVTSSSETGKVKESGPLMVNIPGVFTIKLQQTDANAGQVTVDDISWTNYTSSAVYDRENKPLTFSLEQNYPNPFNPSTNIAFSLSEKGFVRLSVFDLLGREVRCLVNEERGTGVYTESLDLSGFSNGIYIYRLTDGIRSVSKKMSLLK